MFTELIAALRLSRKTYDVCMRFSCDVLTNYISAAANVAMTERERERERKREKERESCDKKYIAYIPLAKVKHKEKVNITRCQQNSKFLWNLFYHQHRKTCKLGMILSNSCTKRAQGPVVQASLP